MNSKWVKLTNVGGWTHFLLRSPWRISTVSLCSHNPVLLLLVQLLIHLWIWMGSGNRRGYTLQKKKANFWWFWERPVCFWGPSEVFSICPLENAGSSCCMKLAHTSQMKGKKSPLFLKPFHQSKQINKQKRNNPWLIVLIRVLGTIPLWQLLHYTQTFFFSF